MGFDQSPIDIGPMKRYYNEKYTHWRNYKGYLAFYLANSLNLTVYTPC